MYKSIFLLIALFFSISFIAAGQSTKITVQRGQKYLVETTNKMTTSAEVMGQTMENNTDSKNTTVYEIQDIDPAEIKLQSTITKMQMNASMMGQEMSYDSDKKNNEGPMADLFSKLINKGRSIKLDNKGKITKQDELEENGQAAIMGAGATGNETATELFIPALIGKELKAGDSFTDIVSVKKEKYESRDSGTYRITAVENGVASVSYAGIQAVTMTMEQMGMEMTSNSNNVIKAEVQMDIKTGLILAKATVTESTTSIDAAGMTIPATGKTIITIKVSPAM